MELRLEHKTLLKSIAFVITRLNDGFSKEQIFDYFEPTLDKYDMRFVDFCIEFSLENGWFIESDEGRYVLTLTGKEFVNSQLG